jgi:hypothetical protein
LEPSEGPPWKPLPLGCLALRICSNNTCDLVHSMAFCFTSWYVTTCGGLRTSSMTDCISPLMNICSISGFSAVYPACHANSLNLVMYVSISRNSIHNPSSCACAWSPFCVSWNCCLNSSRNCIHRSSMLLVGPNPSRKSPMSCVHPAVSGPLISVSMNAIFLMGESNPATS